MVKSYRHHKRGSDDDTVALTAISMDSRSRSGSATTTSAKEEPVYEYKTVKWKDFVTKKKYLPWWILAITGAVLVGLMTLYHDKIVDKLKPISLKIRDLPAGFLIPVAILILISFPPLFGHEIVAVLCGVVWGLWIGFAIVAAGTFLGEVGTWFAFKYAFRRKAEKLEKTNLNYASMARVTRDGGFWIVLIIRFSIIPSHFSTAVFSTCDVNFYFFALATFITLPKQIILVYVGVLLTQSTKNNTLNYLVAGGAFIITVFAGWYIYSKMQAVKKVLLEEQEKRRRGKLDGGLDGDVDVEGMGVRGSTLPIWERERERERERDRGRGFEFGV